MDVDDPEGSLFGSPPPDPNIGRSSSPRLALPPPGCSGLSIWSQNENVGTIALPGSQLSAELSVNPLALPMSSSSMSSLPSASRAARVPNATRKSASKKRSGVTSRASPFTPGPTIVLPNPLEPPPPNFLRNQKGLLGTAGLVAGVKPSQISMKTFASGTSAHNPIVVNDDAPSSSTAIHLPLEQPTLSQNTLPHNIQFPAPSRQAIIASLIKMPDLIRVLEELIKLSSSPQISHKSASFREALNHQEGVPRKRRKLDKVPAGAADWDVPFPFEYGHGPSHYMANWAEERRKTLIGQLVVLITTATKKAAAKAYCKQHGVKAFADLVHKGFVGSVDTETFGEYNTVVNSVGAATPSNLSVGAEKRSRNDGGLDNLLSSLLAVVPTPGSAPSSRGQTQSANGFLTFQDVNSLSSNESVMDDWMSIFHSFSIPDDTPTGELFPTPAPTPDSMGTPTFDDALASLLSQTELPKIPGTMPHPLSTSFVPSITHSLETPYDATTPSTYIPSFQPDHAPHAPTISDIDIDPALLALSNIPSFGGDMSTSSSPLASQSSLGPLTPQSSMWEMGEVIPQTASGMILEPSQFRADSEEAVAALRTVIEKSTKSKGKQRAVKDTATKPRRKTTKQAEIIKAAKERKRQLEVELERAKVEYWEMAIEQSAMIHLLQKL